MTRTMALLVLAISLAVATAVMGQRDAGVAPVIVVETARGTFAFETFPGDAPKTVAHIVDLVENGFYDGLRVHRALAGFVVQFGDPQTRDPDKRGLWGRGPGAASGAPIGTVEIPKRRLNVKGAVGVAHQGDPASGDSQIYITLDDRPDLNGRYAVFGMVTEGEDVPGQLEVGDTITRMFVRR